MANNNPATSKPKIIAVHCGTGKTAFAKAHEGVLDFVTLPYKYSFPEGQDARDAPQVEDEAVKATLLDLNPAFPGNYIQALFDLIERGEHEVVLIPPDGRVLAALERKGIPYTLVYPDRSLKAEYEKRFQRRGNGQEFLDIFVGGWDYFIDRMEAANPTERIVLGPQEYLEDALGDWLEQPTCSIKLGGAHMRFYNEADFDLKNTRGSEPSWTDFVHYTVAVGVTSVDETFCLLEDAWVLVRLHCQMASVLESMGEAPLHAKGLPKFLAASWYEPFCKAHDRSTIVCGGEGLLIQLVCQMREWHEAFLLTIGEAFDFRQPAHALVLDLDIEAVLDLNNTIATFLDHCLDGIPTPDV